MHLKTAPAPTPYRFFEAHKLTCVLSQEDVARESAVGDYRPRHPFRATSSCIRESLGTDSVSAAVQVSPMSAHQIIRSSLNSHHILCELHSGFPLLRGVSVETTRDVLESASSFDPV